MLNKKKVHRASSGNATPFGVSQSGNTKPVALTVKVDDNTYVRLCTLGATQRRTNQDILHEALRDYLERAGA